MFTKEEYERGDAVAFSWHIDDVKSFNNNLTDEQAREILANFEQHHEGSYESMWNDLEYHINEFMRKEEV